MFCFGSENQFLIFNSVGSYFFYRIFTGHGLRPSLVLVVVSCSISGSLTFTFKFQITILQNLLGFRFNLTLNSRFRDFPNFRFTFRVYKFYIQIQFQFHVQFQVHLQTEFHLKFTSKFKIMILQII